MKREIERRIEAVPRIMHEPRLLSTEPSHYILEPQQPYHYRFRAVDDVKTLGKTLLMLCTLLVHHLAGALHGSAHQGVYSNIPDRSQAMAEVD